MDLSTGVEEWTLVSAVDLNNTPLPGLLTPRPAAVIEDSVRNSGWRASAALVFALAEMVYGFWRLARAFAKWRSSWLAKFWRSAWPNGAGPPVSTPPLRNSSMKARIVRCWAILSQV